MEPINLVIYVKKKVWYKCCLYQGLLFTCDRVENKITSANAKSARSLESLSEFLIHQTPVKSLSISCFNEEIQKLAYECDEPHRRNRTRFRMDGYALSLLTKVLLQSERYRKRFLEQSSLQKKLRHLPIEDIPHLYVKLMPPKREVLDYQWNERIITLAMEKRELENAMYWLSTLGGAFSALGDEFHHCAVMAGRISVGQLRIALRLGDALTVARCKLFFALSLMQQDRLLAARKLVEQQYSVAKAATEVDPRLRRMCQGVWAKLQYAYKLRHIRRKVKYGVV